MLVSNRPKHPDGVAAPAAAPVLAIQNLSVRYGSRQILKGLDLAIGVGEIFGLLGPNGAGKTTLIRAICGRVRMMGGRIAIGGRNNARRRALRRIGLVPQEIALFPHLTARENLMTFGRLSGLSRRRTVEGLSFVMRATRLTERADEPVHSLSGGWKRRVNIAAALLHGPALLILDEPTVGVDIDARNTLHGVIRDLSHIGIAVLLATHDLDQAQTLCARVGFLRGGRLRPHGRPESLLREAFGHRRELLVDLLEPASVRTGEMLKRLQFAEHPTGMEWSRLVNGSPERQTELTRALQQTDLSIKEIRFREPGLDSLFLRLGRENVSS